MVKSGDNSHYTLEERRTEEFEVIENVGVLLRLRLKDKTPPCVIKFKPTTSNATFRVFYSEIFKEPEEIDNHGSEVNVRTSQQIIDVLLKLTIFVSFFYYSPRRSCLQVLGQLTAVVVQGNAQIFSQRTGSTCK